MSLTYEDIEAYAFGFGVVLAIYGVFFWLLPKLFSRVQQKVSPITAPVTQAVVNAVKEVVKHRFALPTTEVSGAEAMKAWEASRMNGARGTVLFGGNREGIDGYAHIMSFRSDSAEVYLSRAAKKPDPYPTRSSPKLPTHWPEVGPFHGERNPFGIHLHPEGFKPVVLLVTTPADDDAAILAHLKFGGWNACPEPDMHVALLRKWQRDYGAELVAFTADTLDIRVARRPSTRQEAMQLAREHQKYCPTNEATIAERAAELLLMDWWHFWWD
jgi:hypothetical protein